MISSANYPMSIFILFVSVGVLFDGGFSCEYPYLKL